MRNSDKYHVVLGVTGGIACYKSAAIVSALCKSGINVDVIMTKNAETFITEQTLRTLSRNLVTRDMFKEPAVWNVEHISLARKADCFLIAPCTANVIGKIAGGIADDMLTTTVMATKAPVVIAPAMNDAMYDNPIVQANMEKLKGYGYHFIAPHEGVLAYGGTGNGELASVEEIADYVVNLLVPKAE